MTKREEARIYTGPWPWRLPGLKVIGEGIAVCDIPPGKNSGNPRRFHSEEESMRERARELRSEAREEVKNLSRSELRATIEMTREQLALRWAKLKRTGEEAEKRFDKFKEWIAERLRDNFRDNPKGAEYPYSNLLHGYVRIGIPTPYDQWTHVRARSHLTGMESLRTLNGHIGMFNQLAGRYSFLRDKRFSVALGSSTSNEYESPSPSAQKALSAVARLNRGNDGLPDVDIGEMDIGDVWSYVEEEMGLVNARANLRQDMRGRGKAPDRYPKDTEELLELAREVANKRSQTFATPLNPDG
jgi:hypothetical protein